MQWRPGPPGIRGVNLTIVVGVITQQLASNLIDDYRALKGNGLLNRRLAIWSTLNRITVRIDIVNRPGNRVRQIVLSNAIWIFRVALRINRLTWRGWIFRRDRLGGVF